MATITFASINDTRNHIGTAYTMCVTKAGLPTNVDLFTPTKEMVFGHKLYTGQTKYAKYYAPVSDEEYEEQYRALFADRKAEVHKWLAELTEDVTLCCFCPQGDFCHRRFLAFWLNRYCKQHRIDHVFLLY